MIDTHTHINSKTLRHVREEVIKIKNSDTLDKVINVGLDEETNVDALATCDMCDKFFCALGIHPLYDGNVESILKLVEYSDNRKYVVAIGETGLDSQKDLKPQIRKFIESIELANMLKLPIIIHANNTNSLVLHILSTHPAHYGFIFHCFQPEVEILKDILKKGGYISVGKPITKENARRSLDIVKNIPLDYLLIELDFPFMSKNPTADGRLVFRRIQELRNLEHQELEEALDNNTKRLFYKLNDKHNID